MSAFAIALNHPKNPINVGSALRAAYCFGAAVVIASGHRYRRALTDTYKTTTKIPLIELENIWDGIPFSWTPIAIEFIESAKCLTNFTHPKNACYIFGGEDQTLGANILEKCESIVKIPTIQCLNLAASVNIVLYDRKMKEK